MFKYISISYKSVTHRKALQASFILIGIGILSYILSRLIILFMTSRPLDIIKIILVTTYTCIVVTIILVGLDELSSIVKGTSTLSMNLPILAMLLGAVALPLFRLEGALLLVAGGINFFRTGRSSLDIAVRLASFLLGTWTFLELGLRYFGTHLLIIDNTWLFIATVLVAVGAILRHIQHKFDRYVLAAAGAILATLYLVNLLKVSDIAPTSLRGFFEFMINIPSGIGGIIALMAIISSLITTRPEPSEKETRVLLEEYKPETRPPQPQRSIRKKQDKSTNLTKLLSQIK